MTDRHLPASQKKLRKSREQGEFPKSRDVGTVLLLAAVVGGISFGAFGGAAALLHLARICLDDLSQPSSSLGSTLLRSYAAAVLGPSALGFAAAVGAGFAQSGGTLNSEAFELKLERLLPWPRLKELIFSRDAWIGLGSNMVKVIVLGSVCAWTLWSLWPKWNLPGLSSFSIWTDIASDSWWTFWGRALLVMAVLAAGDFVLQFLRIKRKLRMSTQEVRDEMKEEFGDPIVRSRRRKRQMQLARERSVAEVKNATVVLVNPTHFAVALKYEPGQNMAPRVLAKGKDRQAERIRALARKHGVPVVSQPPLTRALYRAVDVGREIPAELYQAVAVVLAHLFRRKGVVA